MTSHKLSQILTEFKLYINEPQNIQNGSVRINDITLFFEHIGIAFCLMLFAAPMALPLPVPPGINILLASPIILLTFQITFGRKHIWLPKKICDKQVRTETLSAMLEAFIPKLEWMERFTRPRLKFLTNTPIKPIFGTASIIMALTICIPIPGTNTVPSFAIVLMCIGWITHDGIITILGTLIGLLWIALLLYVAIVYGPQTVSFATDILTGQYNN